MLCRRQQILYVFRVSLYKPNALSAGGDIEATEVATDPTPAFTEVPCFYKGTPELEVAEALGLTKELNLFTLDEWHFDIRQPIADAWVIEMTDAPPLPDGSPHPGIGRFWKVRNNPQTVGGSPRRPANFAMVYGVLSNLPGLSGLVSNLS